MIVAIIGVTGIVGKKLTSLLETRKFPIDKFIPIASESSKNKPVLYKATMYNTITLQDFIDQYSTKWNKNVKQNMIVFFCSNSEISRIWAPQILEKIPNIWIIDNSSYFRLDKEIPLVIPEINAETITDKTRIIANPNCSTAQLVLVLFPLHKKYTIKRIVISTYQSVSGAGIKGENQLFEERKKNTQMFYNNKIENAFEREIDLNCIPMCDKLDEKTGYTQEEIKLANETPKILNSNVKVSATAVRVPVYGGHSESVNIEFKNDISIDKVIETLKNTEGVKVTNYTCPNEVKDSEHVYVSRIRKDHTQDNTINLWIVADNIMKGAALNALQIAEYINNKFIISS